MAIADEHDIEAGTSLMTEPLEVSHYPTAIQGRPSGEGRMKDHPEAALTGYKGRAYLGLLE